MENKYQITKTIRFGLTLKKSDKKNKTHQILLDLLNKSQQKIEETVKKANNKTEQDFVRNVRDCYNQMKAYLNGWQQVYERADQISLTKEYYKIIARKANFNGFWTISRFNKRRNVQEEVRQPQTQLIKVSSLTTKYFDKPRKDYIVDYWRENLSTVRRLCNEFKLLLEQYETALHNDDKAHTKPHLVDFRKMFLSLCNRMSDTLVPLVNGSITFDGIDKLADEERNKAVKEFSAPEQRNERQALLQLIEEIRAYFESNGDNVPFGRVTLNKYTAQQKPQNYTDEIKEIIRELHIDTLVGDLQEQDVSNYFQVQKKFIVIESVSKSLVERVQMFKCKPIPVSVRLPLAEYLSEHYGIDKKKAEKVLYEIGTPVSPAYDYSKLNSDEKKDFSLENYPIKLAFDYAWENLAREIKNSGVDFPKEEAKRYLKDHFDVSEETEELQLYARLLFIKEKIATLSNEGNENEVKDRKSIVDEIDDTFREIYYPYPCNQNTFEGYEEDILKWIKYSKEERKLLKKKDKKEYDNLKNHYEKAQQKMGLLRGEQKSKILKYKNLTNKFKTIAIDFGKSFAGLRDKFREENEINKITYCGIIVEDENVDRYLLLQPINDKNDTAKQNDTKIYETESGELTTYQVKSLTSKTLNKMIKNVGGYQDFHSCGGIDSKFAKEKWEIYQNNDGFLKALKKALTGSAMAKDQNWSEFSWDFSGCKTYDAIAKEVDKKSYVLQKGKISIEKITDLVNNDGCLLLPIVNQDITSKTRVLKNQFSKDWQMIFDENLKEYRLHPEFAITYRQPTPDYPQPGEKRYSRFQMIGGFQCEIVPQSDDFISKKEQIEVFNDKKAQEQKVSDFNGKINLGNDYFVIGIDRGIKQLATLCVLNGKGEIQGDFEIYTRTFDDVKKQWIHLLSYKTGILDLSNMRVETTVEGKKVLVDLSAIKTKDENGNYTKENLQTVKLKQLAYIRKLQYKMQYDEKSVLDFVEKHKAEEEIQSHISELISPYKEGERFADLPMAQIKDMLEQFKTLCEEKRDKEKRELCELDAADDLKSGVVANMVGVVAYLVEKYDYKVYVSLENLCRAYRFATDGLNGQTLPSTSQDPDVDFKEQENLVLAGVGTYRFFEMQLLKKLFKMQQDEKIINLVPAFRSVDNYEKLVKCDKENGDKYVNYPFGIVRFVDPKNTSHRCPNCGSTKVSRRNNVITCNDCGFSTANHSTGTSHLKFITNGDDNGAYHIAKKTFENLQNKNGTPN